MSVPQHLHDEIRRLLWAVRDGELTPDDEGKLSAILLNDPEARELYVWYSYLCGSLEWDRSARDRGEGREERGEGREESGEGAIRHSVFGVRHSVSNSAISDFSLPHSPFLIPTSLPSPLSSLPSFVSSVLFSYLVATLILGTALTIAWVWKLPSHVQIAESVPSASPLAPSPSFKMQFVGRITGMVDCQWADPNTAVPGPVAVPLGRKYALSSGLLEITYDTGARVLLQGPCTYEVESSAGGFLSVGKLAAKVEKKAESGKRKAEGSNPQSLIPNPSLPTTHYPLFTIKTPTATVTDLGTEFGVEVVESGATFAHVYDGVVEMQSVEREGQRGQAVRLVKNESARVGQDNRGEVVMVRDAKIAPSTFVRVGQLSKVAEESHFKAFRRWQTYSNTLRNDPSLMAYYDFQRQKDSPSVLRNVAAGDNRSLDGVIQAVVWGSGHMPGKHALLFHSRADRVEVDLPQTVDDMTLAAWVCVESLASPSESEFGYSGLLTSNGWGDAPGQTHWQIRSDGRLGLIVAGGCTWYSSEPIFDQTRRDGWTHLAVVYDHNAAKIACYVNGKIRDEATVEMHVPIRFGPAWIGHWNGWEVGRNLYGRIDELAIFGRPLKSTEIQEMYEAGRPEDIGHAGDHTGKQ